MRLNKRTSRKWRPPSRRIVTHGINRAFQRTRRAFAAGGTGRQIATLSSATAFAQILTLFAMPLITRLYSAEAFGHLGMFIAITSMILPLASLRYEWAILVPADERDARDLLALCLCVLPLACGVVAAVVVSGAGMHPGFILTREELLLLPIAVGVLGGHTVGTHWLLRTEAFGLIARNRFLAIVTTLACQVLLAWQFGNSTSLIAAYILGYLAALMILAYKVRAPLIDALTGFEFGRIVSAARRYRAFAVVTAPSQVANVLGLQLPNALIPVIYGAAVGGNYMLAARVIDQPTILIGESVSHVFRGSAPRLLQSDPHRLWMRYRNLNILLAIVVSPALALTVFGPELFTLVFGNAWREAGTFASVMVLAGVVGVIASATGILPLLSRNTMQSAWEVARIGLVMTTLGATYWFSWSAFTCVAALAVSSGVSYLALMLLNACIIRGATQSWRGCICRYLAGR